MVHETIATEKKHQKHLTGRARAVAQAAEAAVKAQRVAEEALRCFEADYGHTPTLVVDEVVPEKKTSSKKKREDEDAEKQPTKKSRSGDEEVRLCRVAG